MEKTKIFFWGMLISFLGSLPLGTINVAATQLAVRDGAQAAIIFSIGAMLVEILYVRLTLMSLGWITKQQKLFRVFSLITALLLILMAAASIVSAVKMASFGNALSSFAKYHFLFGVSLSAVNPLHIIFWMGWTGILLNKAILVPTLVNYNIYIVGIGTGTMLGLTSFIYGGAFITCFLRDRQQIMNWFVGGILLMTALIQLRKLIYKPSIPGLNMKSRIK
ncbi:MAG TPA: LysE family transporter [Puia sp.]